MAEVQKAPAAAAEAGDWRNELVKPEKDTRVQTEVRYVFSDLQFSCSLCNFRVKS